jgi:hypothetical protein
MIADRDYAMLEFLSKECFCLQQQYSELNLLSNVMPLHPSSFLDSKEPWDYAMRRRGCLRERVTLLVACATRVLEVLGFDGLDALDPARDAGVTIDSLQRALARFGSIVDNKLDALKPLLTAELRSKLLARQSTTHGH